MSSAILLPRRLHIGAGSVDRLPETLKEFGFERPLIVTDPFIAGCGYLSRVTDCLAGAGYTFSVFDQCVPDPTTDSVSAGLAALSLQGADVLIGLGGGSSLDTAKAMAVMAQREGPLRDYKVPATLDSGIPVIAIPTTAGTGSEATGAAVVTDTETDEKMLCLGMGLMPLAALVDFELTLTMPGRLTADTGLDTLCHALEAYVSRKANPFTDALAEDVMAAVARWLPTAYEEPDNRAAREAMMMAAMKGGMAFSNASVTLIHGMSRPVGAHFHVPHGMSNAMLLPAVTAWSTAGALGRYAAAARVMGFATSADDDARAVDGLIEGLHGLCQRLKVPGPADFGIDESAWFEAIPTMAAQALASGSPDNNPRIPDATAIAQLYEQVWRGEVVPSIQ